MNFKKLITTQGMKLMQSPQVMKLMQNEKVMKAMMQAFQLRGKVQESIDQRVEAIAKQFNLVTKAELRELKRTIRKLEQELERAKKPASS